MPLSPMRPAILSPARLFIRNLRSAPSTSTSPKRVAFVFDIDGVLLRGHEPLPTARAALSLLQSTPHIFLTNGGGHSEAFRASNLSTLLSHSISPGQVILSHTPMAAHASTPRNTSTLTVGGAACGAVAQSYGFTNVLDIARKGLSDPSATPFARYDSPDPAANLHPLTASEVALAKMPVGAVLVMADSHDLGRDVQLIVDAIGECPSVRPEACTVIFSNADVTFPGKYVRPRLAGGNLRVVLDALLGKLRGVQRTDYSAVQLGKPETANYEAAEKALSVLAEGALDKFDEIVMVGDNPASDGVSCCASFDLTADCRY